MITYEEARHIILRQATPPPPVIMPLQETVNHVCAGDIASSKMVPPFANSAMDGFAVRAAMLAGASKKNPVTMPVSGSTAAGDTPGNAIHAAWEIMTGAPLPAGADAVVRVEDADIREYAKNGRPTIVSFSQPVYAGENMRKAGEDFRPGDHVVRSGTMLEPHHIMALAALGIGKVQAYPQPRIAVIATGKELVDDVDALLTPGKIRNSNAPYLLSALTFMGGKAGNAQTIPDEPEVFERGLQAIIKQKIEVVISTGAVSAGRYDFVPESLEKLGAEILFHKVAIRPGKPLLYALLPNGTHYFGLPGNPVSAAVGLRFFVCPLLWTLQGLREEMPISASVADNIRKKPGLRFFQKAHVYLDNAGQWKADILTGQESFKIHPLLKANAWAVLPEDMTECASGTNIAVYPLYPGIWRTITPKQERRYDNDRFHQRATA